MAESSRSLPFQASLQATAQGEVWDHTDTKKFEQFGWRTTKNDETYNSAARGALMGNWVEDRCDVAVKAQKPALPDQHAHYFATNYDQSYGPRQKEPPKCLKSCLAPHDVRAFPVHQPELDPPHIRAAHQAYTTSNMTYGSKKA